MQIAVVGMYTIIGFIYLAAGALTCGFALRDWSIAENYWDGVLLFVIGLLWPIWFFLYLFVAPVSRAYYERERRIEREKWSKK